MAASFTHGCVRWEGRGRAGRGRGRRALAGRTLWEEVTDPQASRLQKVGLAETSPLRPQRIVKLGGRGEGCSTLFFCRQLKRI